MKIDLIRQKLRNYNKFKFEEALISTHNWDLLVTRDRSHQRCTSGSAMYHPGSYYL